MSVTTLSNKKLLAKVASRQAAAQYRESLRPLFKDGKPGHVKYVAARELVKRWLGEELRRGCVLTAPGAVRDFLRVQFAGQEHESFTVLFLDAQNRLIVAEELFRRTLTQTSVYPREVLKAALQHNAAPKLGLGHCN